MPDSFSFFFLNGRAFLFCCFFVFKLCAAIIFEINLHENETKTSEYPNVEYDRELLDAKIKKKIIEYADSGYPFVKITPKITEENDSVKIDLFIDKGVFVENTDAKIIIDGKLKRHLIQKPVEQVLKNYNYYNYSNFEKIKNILQNKKYINSVYIFSPEISDSSAEIPIKIESVNSMFFDGGLGFTTYPENAVTGNINLEIINVFGLGETIDFSFLSEELFYRILGSVDFPYVFKTPVGALFSAEIEVADSSYGSVSLSAGVQFFNENFAIKIMADYNELSVKDSVSRYSGISFSLDNGIKKFFRSKLAFQMEFSAKSGIISDKKDLMPKAETMAKFAVHAPFGDSRLAFLTKPSLGIIAFETPQNLHKTQMFRIGGAKSIRGYQESLFSCLSFGALGNDLRYYISDLAAVYLLFDIAAIMSEKYDFSNASLIFGYGTGITMPIRKLSFSLEWARHYKEVSSPGRIHFRIGN